MQTFTNGPLSQEYAFPEESTVRRYYIQTSSVSKVSNLEKSLKDGPDQHGFYSVVRRNYTSEDVPFSPPRIFSYFTSDMGLFGTPEEGTNDFFDKGVTSTEEGDLSDESAFPVKPPSPPVSHKTSPKKKKRVSEPEYVENYDDGSFFDNPFENDVDKALEYLQSQTAQSSPLKQSTRSLPPEPSTRSLHPKHSTRSSPLKLSNRSSVPTQSNRASPELLSITHKRSIISQTSSLESTVPPLQLEDLKSSRGSDKLKLDKPKKTPKITSRTNSLYSIDRKSQPVSKRGPVPKFPSKDSHESYKVTKKGPYQIVRGPRKVVGLPKPSPKLDKKAKGALKPLPPPKEELALFDSSRFDEGDYDMGGFDDIETSFKRLKAPKRKPRQSISSAALLNSWYITARSSGEETEWAYEREPIRRTGRYPKRIRRPASQYWMSNLAPDGSSVVFLGGVCSKTSNRSFDLNNPIVPDASLVLKNDHGEVSLEVVKKDTEDPKQKSISDYLKTLAPSGPRNTPKRLGNAHRGPGRPRKNLSDSTRSDRGNHLLGLENVKSGDKQKKVKRRLVKPRRDLTWEEAMQILEKDRQKEGVQDKVSEIQTQRTLTIEDRYDAEITKESRELKKKVNARKKMLSKFKSESDKYDSFVEDEGDGIYYTTVYRQEELTTVSESDITFSPMIMTSQCRTSEVVIPPGQTLDFGDLKSNFICGYVYSGDNILIKGEREERRVKAKDLFCLPSFNQWILENNSNFESHIALTFVNV